MALNNEQYSELMRAYDEKRLRHLRIQNERKEEVYSKYPEIGAVRRALSENASLRAQAAVLRQPEMLERLTGEAAELREKDRELLLAHGIPEDYLELSYDCPDCRDTGFIRGQRCHCFRQAAAELLYDRSRIREILSRENFSTLTTDYYDRTKEGGRRSQYEDMQDKIRLCRGFAEHFGDSPDSLLFYGPAGVGKTFLSNCIAKEVLDRGFAVAYFSAIELFSLFEKSSFGYDEEARNLLDEYVLESDLLIIDDLGTELVNGFTQSRLFYCVNERLNARKSTVISTNLYPEELRSVYTERISSRILSAYTPIELGGRDIRILKKFGRT